MQKGTKGAAEQFNKFVEGTGDGQGHTSKAAVEPEKKDFWDSFGSPTAGGSTIVSSGPAKKSSAIGTAAMKGGGTGGGTAGAGKEEWGDDGWDKF